MMTKQALGLTAILGSLAGNAWAGATTPAPTHEQALEQAKQKGKPLVIEFFAEW